MSRYTVIREIGRGGFGVVEEVEDGKGQRFAQKHSNPHHTTFHIGPRKKRQLLTDSESDLNVRC